MIDVPTRDLLFVCFLLVLPVFWHLAGALAALMKALGFYLIHRSGCPQTHKESNDHA